MLFLPCEFNYDSFYIFSPPLRLVTCHFLDFSIFGNLFITHSMNVPLLDLSLFDTLSAQAVVSPRKRSHHNLHATLEDPIHRLVMALEPGTYVRPHRHRTPPKWELLVALRGRAAVLVLDDNGTVLHRAEISANGQCRGCEIPEGAWHTLAALESNTVVLEVKSGPYQKPPPEDFASWAPEENTPSAAVFEIKFAHAKPGELLPS